MSLITGDPEDSPRDCSRSSSRPHKHHHHHHGNRRRRALIAVCSTVASLLSLALILWLTLRPSSPSFSLLAATATVANASAGAATIITVDAALTAHNPNARATALYDQLQATAPYAGVPLGAADAHALRAARGRRGSVGHAHVQLRRGSWRSPSSPPERALLRVRIQGLLRWKVSATHGLTVDCIAAVLLQAPAIPLPPGQLQEQGSSFPSQSSQCATHVQ
ncbi:unnamed protein product [Miscanthus lutarioriparius]|uniref:Late embryogenesis abundant protein LEA-2 subgroup domain-containing protein n=1 Tax=Miscanthus lutarioriparius TaxID=422564 RepID=A0A811PM78_9POAL|nr:unnamed protein product [Miscanthus lutarioriparius]